MTVGHQFKRIRDKLFLVYRKGFLLGAGQRNAELNHSATSSGAPDTVEYHLVQVANNMISIYRSGYKQGLIASGAITTIRIDIDAHITLPRTTLFNSFLQSNGAILKLRPLTANIQLTPMYVARSAKFLRTNLNIQPNHAVTFLAASARYANPTYRINHSTNFKLKKGSGQFLRSGMHHTIILDANAYIDQLSAIARVCRASLSFGLTSTFTLNQCLCSGFVHTNITMTNAQYVASVIKGMYTPIQMQFTSYQQIRAGYRVAAAKFMNLRITQNTQMNASIALNHGRFALPTEVLIRTVMQATAHIYQAARLHDLTQLLQYYDNKTLYVVGTQILDEV